MGYVVVEVVEVREFLAPEYSMVRLSYLSVAVKVSFKNCHFLGLFLVDQMNVFLRYLVCSLSASLINSYGAVFVVGQVAVTKSLSKLKLHIFDLEFVFYNNLFSLD